MTNKNLLEMLKIADIHVNRITHAINRLQQIFPISEQNVENMTEENFLFIELLVNRFAKLQDFLGSKIIDPFLEITGESITNLTMIDKINKMEALGIIPNANIWSKMREIRNHLAHEYPDHPEITTKYLNQVFEMAPMLLDFYKNIKNIAISIP